jgi:thiamine biosynthesis lipoprotein
MMMYKHEFRAMGCHMLAALHYPSQRGAKLLARVPEWFETWEACLSRFRPESELNRLNRSSGKPVQVSGILWNVFQASLAAEKQSAGLVTPTLLDPLIEAGYSASFEQLPIGQETSVLRPRRHFSLQAVAWDASKHTLRLPEGLHLDFGGVAKGWAAHQATKRLRAYGPALVDAGGDIAISGLQPGGEPWAVGVDDPLQPGNNLEVLRLGRCGVATSGKNYRRWQQGGSWKHHIIDPRIGEPAQTDVLSATVIAPTVLEAEVAAKVVLILGSQEGLAWLGAKPNHAGLVVLEDGQIVRSPRINPYLISRRLWVQNAPARNRSVAG